MFEDDKRFDWKWSQIIHRALIEKHGQEAENPFVMETWWKTSTPSEKRAEIESWNFG